MGTTTIPTIDTTTIPTIDTTTIPTIDTTSYLNDIVTDINELITTSITTTIETETTIKPELTELLVESTTEQIESDDSEESEEDLMVLDENHRGDMTGMQAVGSLDERDGDEVGGEQIIEEEIFEEVKVVTPTIENDLIHEEANDGIHEEINNGIHEEINDGIHEEKNNGDIINEEVNDGEAKDEKGEDEGKGEDSSSSDDSDGVELSPEILLYLDGINSNTKCVKIGKNKNCIHVLSPCAIEYKDGLKDIPNCKKKNASIDGSDDSSDDDRYWTVIDPKGKQFMGIKYPVEDPEWPNRRSTTKSAESISTYLLSVLFITMMI